MQTTLKQLLHERNITFREIGEHLGVTKATISSWGVGRRKIPRKYHFGIAAFLDVPVRTVAMLVPEPPGSIPEHRILQVMGKGRTLVECTEFPYGLSLRQIHKRLESGFSDEEAVFPGRMLSSYPESERISQYVMWNDKRINLAAWAIQKDIPLHRLYARLGYGWTIQDTLNVPFERHQTFNYVKINR